MKYSVHVYKVSEKYEVPVEADNATEAMEIAAREAKRPEAQELYRKESQLFILPFELEEVTEEKTEEPEEEDPEDYDIPPHTD